MRARLQRRHRNFSTPKDIERDHHIKALLRGYQGIERRGEDVKSVSGRYRLLCKRSFDLPLRESALEADRKLLGRAQQEQRSSKVYAVKQGRSSLKLPNHAKQAETVFGNIVTREPDPEI